VRAIVGSVRKGARVEILTLLLPWFWVAMAVWILLRAAPRVSRPAAVKAFAIVLVLIGVSDFFVTPTGPPSWWLLAWKIALVGAAIGILFHLRSSSGKDGEAKK